MRREGYVIVMVVESRGLQVKLFIFVQIELEEMVQCMGFEGGKINVTHVILEVSKWFPKIAEVITILSIYRVVCDTDTIIGRGKDFYVYLNYIRTHLLHHKKRKKRNVQRWVYEYVLLIMYRHTCVMYTLCSCTDGSWSNLIARVHECEYVGVLV